MQHTLEIPAVALKNICAGLGKLINSRPTLPALGCLRVEADAKGGARFQATDLDSFVTCEVPATSPHGFPASLLPFDALNRIAKSAKNPLALVAEQNKVSVRSTFGTATVAQSLATHALAEWPEPPAKITATIHGDAAFKQSLRDAFECASSDTSRYVLNGACLDVSQAGCHSIIATDGRHLFAANTFQFELPVTVIVPSRKFLGWSGFSADGDWHLGVALDKQREPAWVQLQSDHWTIITKAITGNYPNWRQVIPKENGKVTRIVLADAAKAMLLETLPRLPGLDDDYQPVTLVTRGGQLWLLTKAKDDPHANEMVIEGATVTGPDTQVRLDRNFILKALRFALTTIELTDALSAILFTAPGRKLIAMPLRLEAATATPRSKATTAPVTPSAGQPKTTATEARNPMPPETTPAPRRGNLNPTETAANGTALAAAVTQIESLRTSLRNFVGELSTTLDLLRAAEREKKSAAREVESVRNTLRSLQKLAV